MSHPVPREKVPWFPTIDAVLCDGCGVCVDFCPNGVYTREDAAGAVRVIHPFQCVVGCNNCESLCPRKAISFPDLETINVIIRKIRAEGEPA